ncbi:hypothetical protein BN2476_520085 [Paraburkholderia piptadeniae]|uniref:DUF1232 domain-containing protein n=1 Tax=Paraburkholderia piptadeniae TaxID=1701573 RepID=A0A1N7SH47_9BURK|nr:hypothetical protein BN2476_520085 [Paraburkholderia piptadeniae]
MIPDLILVLGCIDDALLLPGLICLTIRLLPKKVVDESRARADAGGAHRRCVIRDSLCRVGLLKG